MAGGTIELSSQAEPGSLLERLLSSWFALQGTGHVAWLSCSLVPGRSMAAPTRVGGKVALSRGQQHF